MFAVRVGVSRRVGGLLAGLGEGADLAQLATGAVGVARNAGVMGELFEQLEELDAAVLGNGALQDRAQGVDVGLRGLPGVPGRGGSRSRRGSRGRRAPAG